MSATQYGRYLLLAELGRGSITTAYKAKSFGVEGFEKTLVIKRLLPDLARAPAVVTAFVEQAKRAVRLSHANIAQVVDVGSVEESARDYYVATEFVNGPRLTEFIHNERIRDGLPPSLSLFIAAEIAKALEHAHRRLDERMHPLGIVHASLNPGNVMVTSDGEVRVTDFCLGHALDELSTPDASRRRGWRAEYLSPEQLSRRPLDPRSDIYSLGVILCHLLGAEASSSVDSGRADFDLGSLRSRVADGLVDLLKSMLQLEPAERLADTGLLYEELLALSFATGLRARATDLAQFWQAYAGSPEEPFKESLREPRPTTLPPPARAEAKARTALLPRPAHWERRFVGRKQLLADLGDGLAKAVRGGLKFIELKGPAGIGKSRLVREATRRLKYSALNVVVSVVRCAALRREEPLASLAEMAQLLCGYPSLSDPAAAAEQERGLRELGLSPAEVKAVFYLLGQSKDFEPARNRPLHSALLRLLHGLSAERSQILVWEDAEHMDAASRTLLIALQASPVPRCAVVLTDADAVWIPEGSECLKLELPELTASEVSELIQRRLSVGQIPKHLSQLALERTRGRPLHVEEFLMEALETGALTVGPASVEFSRNGGSLSVAQTLGSLLDDRYRLLERPLKLVALALAIFDEAASLEQLQAMLKLPASELEASLGDLLDWGLAREPRHGYFEHALPLFAEVARRAQPVGQIEALATQAAEAFQRSRDPLALARAGSLLRLGGKTDQAADCFWRAGSLAAHVGRPESATQLIGHALHLVDFQTLPTEKLLSWIRALASVAHSERDAALVLELAPRLEQHLLRESSSLDQQKADCLIQLASLQNLGHRHLEARRLLQAIAGSLEGLPGLLCRAQVLQAEIAIRVGEFARALEALQRCDPADLSRSERYRMALLKAHALGASGHHQEAIESFELAVRSSPGQDSEDLCDRTRLEALLLGFRGKWVESARAFEQAAGHARAGGLLQQLADNLLHEADVLLRLEDTPRAYAVLQRAQEAAQEAGSERLLNLTRMMVAYLEAERGTAAARSNLGECLALAESRLWTRDVSKGRLLLGKLYALDGATTAARRELLVAHQVAEDAGDWLGQQDCRDALKAL